MGQQQSKDELLYQQVSYGNTEGIKALRREGAGLEWIDKEGKTPLITACMNSELYNVAKTLIELGANVNAYRPGRHAGTPLHHAAKRGLEQTVKLLLTHGANALIMNDDCQTPLDVARAKGYSNVVRAIESHICLFSGWLREIYGPDFLDVFASQLLSRKVWVVVLPIGSRNLANPFKLELAMYSSELDAQPRNLIALWKANMEEPKFNRPDPTVIITDISNISRRWRRRRGIVAYREGRGKPRGVRQTRIKLATANEGDKHQLLQFCNACKGIPQVMHANFPFNTLPPTAPAPEQDLGLAMAVSASFQSPMEARPPHIDAKFNSRGNASSSSHMDWGTSSAPASKGSSGFEIQEASSSSNPAELVQTLSELPNTPEIAVPTSVPSAPPIQHAIIEDGPIQYPSIDISPVDLSSPMVENLPAKPEERKEDLSSSCVICLDAPVEGACIPCGHMAGCMSCLSEIKAKKWGCPVCRAKIDQVVRLYAV